MAASLYHWFCQYQVSQHINVTVKHIGSLRVSTLKVYIHFYTENFSIHYYCLLHGVGIPRKLRVAFCHCEPDIVTLVQLNYWPATPSRPSIAFSFSLLDWLQALLLECQVPVQNFSNALEFIIATKYGKVMIAMYDFFKVYNTGYTRRCRATSTLFLSKLLRNTGTCLTLH